MSYFYIKIEKRLGEFCTKYIYVLELIEVNSDACVRIMTELSECRIVPHIAFFWIVVAMCDQIDDLNGIY